MKRNLTIPNFLLSASIYFLLLVFAAASLSAQNIRNTDYSPDKALKSNARVNPSTLAMELSIPLGSYAGRTGNGMPIALNYSSKVWEMKNIGLWQSLFNNTLTGVKPLYAKRSAGGWTSSLGTPRIDYKYDPYQGNNQDVAYEGQTYAPAPWENPVDNDLFYIKRLHVQMPDGSTHEFRASDTPIDCGSINTGCTPDLTGTFLSVDGSRMRLESGTSSSTLYLPDGSRYVFGEPVSGTLGTPAHTFYDRHGNIMTFNNTTRAWTDTMGRTITDPIAFNWDGTQNQVVAVEEVKHFPGFGSGNYDIWYSWSYLKDPGSGAHALDDPNATLNNLSDMYCQGNLEHEATGPDLFSNNEAPVRVCGSGYDTQGPAFNPIVLTKIKLPNNQYYEFKYNVYGEITKIIYPTGAYERFVYAAVAPVSVGSPAYDQANRGVTHRYVSEKGDGSDEMHWSYSVARGTATSPAPYIVTANAPDGSKTEQYIEDEPYPTDVWRPYGFGNEKTGRSYEDRVYDNSTNHYLLQRKLTKYETSGPLSGGWTDATRDMRPTKEISITFDPTNSNALATMSETVYDTAGNTDAAYFSSLNAKQSKVYNYVVVSATTAASANITTAAAWFSSSDLAKTSEVDYLYDSNYKARNINGLATETRIKDASGTVKAKSQVTYDGVALLDESESTHWQNPNTNYRGLVTLTRSWHDIAANQYIDTRAQYDLMGNLRYSWDGSNNLSQTEYESTYDYAYPTLVKTPVPDSAGTYGANTVLQTAMAYDYNTGLPTSTTDANGQTTSISYRDPDSNELDPLLRVRKVTAPNGAKTITTYGDGNSSSTRWVTVKSQIDDTNWKQGTSWFDGLGRSVLKQSVDDAQADIYVLTCYDAYGRVQKSSNPVRSSASPTCTSSLEWTTPAYDSAGRVSTVTSPDSAVVTTGYSLATSGSQIGTAVTVTDQAGKLRRSVTNALGQLSRVDEPDGTSTTGSLGNIDSPTQPTVYSYDTLNNLTTVLQASSTTAQCGGASTCSQTRTFSYDSLSRLKSATNPELGTTSTNGTINYTYDSNNNLATKTDPRGVVTTYAYDTLNRVKTRTYTNEPTGQAATPAVAYYYDNVTNAKGKLVKVSSSVSTTEYTSFDILGRVTGHKQTTDGGDSAGYSTSYTYNLGGAMIEETYPSTRVVKNVLDANGDLAEVDSKKTSTDFYRPYVNSFVYNAAGAVSSLKLGNGKFESTTFNSRLQPTQIALGSSINDTSLLKLDYTYNTSGNHDNNGNILTQTIKVPPVGSNTGFTAVQTYSYDSLNRIDDSNEVINSTTTWRQDFTYDRYGNRNFNETNTTTLPKACGTSPNFAVCAEDKKIYDPAVNTANNRLSTSDGYTFDNAGNTVNDPQLRKFTYDAENKQTKVETVNSGGTVTGTVGEYKYDGDGKRIKKYVPSTGETTIFVYDAGSKLIAEYSTVVASSGEAKISYLTNDHLGSPRITTDAVGQVISRRDFMPFGEEILRANYGTDSVRQKFTGYERDDETELDYAQARMYAIRLGRFTSVDPISMLQDRQFDPQQINLYAYCRNNPLLFVDPTGMVLDPSKWNEAERKAFAAYLEYLNQDKEKNKSELDTIARLERSKVNYIVKLNQSGTDFVNGNEGGVTTNGTDVFINIANQGNDREQISLNATFGHELEHARQFDNGEFGFVSDENGNFMDTSGKFVGKSPGLDITDEVKAWNITVKLSTPRDHHVKGGSDPDSQFRILDEFSGSKDKPGVLDRMSELYKSLPRKEGNVPTLKGQPPGFIVRVSAGANTKRRVFWVNP